MGKKKKAKMTGIKLMVKDSENIMLDYVWAAEDEIQEYKKQGYELLNKGRK